MARTLNALLTALALALAFQTSPAQEPAATAAVSPPPTGVITRLATRAKVVALTFDGCQAGQRMTLDRGITDLLVARQIPFTIFAGGRFARDNAPVLRELATHPFVDIENHSWSHPRDMTLLEDDRIRVEVARAATMIRSVTGRRTTVFRFPGGNADQRTVDLVRGLGYRVVHWRWAEGDPDPNIDADRLVEQTLARTRPGDILIFHVNGRGWHTADALPRIVDGLRSRGYAFVPLLEYLPQT